MAGLLGGDPAQLNLDAGGSSAILQGKLEEADHSSTNWYFPREELDRTSPSLRDGIDSRRETYFRKSYCTFLQDLGMRLKVPQVTIATAITFCHRFYLRQSHARNDRFMIATVCMFLAGKVEETPRVLKDVIYVSYTLRNKKDPSANNRIKQKDLYEAQKQLVLYGERLVLTTLGFDLNVHHPYRPLVAAIKKFNVSQHALAQVAWNFVNDGLRTSLCLQFKPHHIAAGAIFLAAKFLKVKLPIDGERAWWQEFDVTPRQLEEVSNQMLELYEQNRAGQNSRSDALEDPNASDRNGVEPAANGHLPPEEQRREAALPPREVENNRDGHYEMERAQARPKQVPETQNGYDSRTRGEAGDRRRVADQTDTARDEVHHKDIADSNLDDRVERVQQQQQDSSKRKREMIEKKWSKPEEGELPPSRGEDQQQHYHSSSRPTGEKRYDSSDRDYRSSRESGQDYRHHSSDHHGSYHYQGGGGENRSRNHSKDRGEWQERDQKKNRHKYS
ncbi:cyclin-T1-3 [Selaginella moellendorffii]|nr:cyclin-T1-3 [Selaginella moellendorffii]|eukprot:XP_024540063.1 cyclin-T1-3 [Selaginella moellendorffii]